MLFPPSPRLEPIDRSAASFDDEDSQLGKSGLTNAARQPCTLNAFANRMLLRRSWPILGR
jgi:hypothetical protein